jgi:hypothetical protein
MRFLRRRKGIIRRDRVRNETVVSEPNMHKTDRISHRRKASELVRSYNRMKEGRLTREIYETRA